jgi:hypothetical protein
MCEKQHLDSQTLSNVNITFGLGRRLHQLKIILHVFSWIKVFILFQYDPHYLTPFLYVPFRLPEHPDHWGLRGLINAIYRCATGARNPLPTPQSPPSRHPTFPFYKIAGWNWTQLSWSRLWPWISGHLFADTDSVRFKGKSIRDFWTSWTMSGFHGC